MSPKDVMLQTLHAWMIGDYGHDLPTEHFEQEVDRLLEGLGEAGFAIVPREPTNMQIISALEWALEWMRLHKVDGLSPFKDYPPPLKETTAGMYAAMLSALSPADRPAPTRCRNCGEPTRDGMFCGTCREMGCGDNTPDNRTPRNP